MNFSNGGNRVNILVTGANGFIAKNLCQTLSDYGYKDILRYSHQDESLLEEYTIKSDFIIHLAGVNRPKDDSEFIKGNYELTKSLVSYIIKHKKNIPIIMSSSIQAESDTLYGKSKLLAEQAIKEYSEITGANTIIYRLPNVFGKWCRPNYNSVVATFCHNISRSIPININDKNSEITLIYIDDLVFDFIKVLKEEGKSGCTYRTITPSYTTTIGALADTLKTFSKSRETLIMPDMSNQFNKKLYSTYLSYIDNHDFCRALNMKKDRRGWLAEVMKSEYSGQIFVSKTSPGVTRGLHYHYTKCEKFLVVSGLALIKFKNIATQEIIEYTVDGKELILIDSPVGYIHTITNIGESELITIFWANEIFDRDNPDTYIGEI